MILLPLIPLLAWPMLSARTHWILASLYALAGAALLARFALRFRRWRRQAATAAARPDALWPASRSAEAYGHQIRSFLDRRDWLVGAITTLGPDRLLLTVRRERHAVTLLCLRAGAAPTQADLARLAERRGQDDAGCMVVLAERGAASPPRRPPDPQTPLQLRHGALARLDEVLGH